MLAGEKSLKTLKANGAFVRSLELNSNGKNDVISVAVKDCIDVRGTVTGLGSAAFAGAAPATSHAAVVQQLLDSGCTIIGKTNMHELAYGMTGVNEFTGTPLNPIWPDIIPGGSSSGSAVAVAAGLCDFAIGTDTGGSIRQPAICCGVYGIKPTYGRISRAGCHPANSSLDSVGLFARTAPMLSRGMRAIDPGFTPVTLDTAPKFARIKATLDKSVDDHLVYDLMEGVSLVDDVMLDYFDAAFDAGMTLIGAETALAFGHLISDNASLGNDIRTRLAAACNITPEAVAKAERIRIQFTAAVDRILETTDVLITPALPMGPPTLEEARDPKTVIPLTRFLRPFNLSGHPAIVLPCDPTNGMSPMGVQIVGRKGADAHLCATAEWMAHTMSVFRKED